MSIFSEIRTALKTKFDSDVIDSLKIYQLHHPFYENTTIPLVNYGKTTNEKLRALIQVKKYIIQGLVNLNVTIDDEPVKADDINLLNLADIIEECSFIQKVQTQIQVYQTSFCKYNYLYLKLTTENGTPLPNKTLQVNNNNYITDSNGIIKIQYTSTGTYNINANFAKIKEEGTSTEYQSSQKTFTITVTDFKTTTYIAANVDNVTSLLGTDYGSNYLKWYSLSGSGTSICGNGTLKNSIHSDSEPRYAKPLKYYNFKPKDSSNPTIQSNDTIYSITVKWSDSTWNWEKDSYTTSSATLSAPTKCRLLNVNGSNYSNIYEHNVSVKYRSTTNHSVTYTNSNLGGTGTYAVNFNTPDLTNKKLYLWIRWGANSSNNYCRLKCYYVSLVIKYKPYQAPMT